MARSWTPSQETAMTLRGKTLLVSAAAGSGKTSVLTERIIRSLLDPENPADLSRMLIVTFTRAAASELKGRIAAALSAAMAENPGNKHLSRQLFLLGSAQISTIDSFFQKTVRANFEQLSLPASFRLADEGELLSLRMDILNTLVEEFYQKYDVGAEDDSPFGGLRKNRFAYFMDHLMSDRSDGRAEELLLSLPRLYAAEPEGVEVLKKCAAQMRADADAEFLTTSFGRALCKYLTELFTSIKQYLDGIAEYAAPMPDLNAAISGVLSADTGYAQAVLNALDEGSYERLQVVLPSFIGGKFPSLKSLKTPRMEQYQAWRNSNLKGAVKEALALVEASTERLRDTFLSTAGLLDILYEFYSTFDARLLAEKSERGVLEFDDMRAMLYKLLSSEDGSASAFADSLSEQYDAVYIDEYQDVDFLQDRIFSLIGRDRRFMVGDIKQSIYGFRGSEPSIFANYRKKMPLHSDPAARDADGSCVFMSENFRCDEPVIRFANQVCSFLFSACEESVGYRADDDLKFSKQMPENLPTGLPAPVKVAVFDSTLTQSKVAGEEEHDPDEPVWVAAEISRLLREGVLDNNRPIEPSDIAILVRKNKQGEAFARELKKLNIPVAQSTSSGIMEMPLLADLLNLLRAIDNPYRDLPLSEFLLSSLGGFTLEELSEIRDLTDGSLSLFDAMEFAAESNKAEASLCQKAKMLCTWFAEKRLWATSLSADRFLRLLYQTELLLPYADTPAALFLYEQARVCQKSAFCGLYEFLGAFTRLLENGKLSAKGFEKPESAVTVMTVHNSKGLEFPVVFCVAVGSNTPSKGLDAPILLQREVGCAAKHYNPVTEELEETPLRVIAKTLLEREDTEESIRTLYVALTRARERLYVTGTLSGQWSKTLDAASLIRRGDRAAILSTSNTLTWILAALSEREDPACPWHLSHCETGTVEAGIPLQYAEETSENETPVSHIAAHYAAVLERHAKIEKSHSALPTKVAASKICADLLDTLQVDGDEDENALRAQIELMRKTSDFDDFLARGAKPTAAEIGTATHAFLELCDFNALSAHGVAAECKRLTENGYLSLKAAEMIDREQLEAFRKSDLADLIGRAKEIKREQKFAIFIPSERLTKKPETAAALAGQTMFVQGSIDLLLLMEGGEICLVDYKTDRMRPEEKASPEVFRARMLASHGAQLSVYAQAVEELFGKFPDSIRLYSMPLGSTVCFSADEIRAVF